MADAMDRVRAAEARYQEVIERTTTLDRHVTELDAHLANLRWTAEKTVEVLSNLRSELEREERAAKHRSETIEQANRIPLPVHRWFFPVVFTALFFGLFGDFVREAGDRLRFFSEFPSLLILSRRRCLWCSFQIRSASGLGEYGHR